MDNGASSYRRFLDGDKSAFDEIMQELFHSLCFFINRYVGDVHTAEDIAIEVFSDLIVHKSRYNFKVSLKTYLFMLGRSRALDYIKHRKVLEFATLESADGIEEQKTLEELILLEEKKRVVNAALGRLPKDMRLACHLFYFEEMSYDEIARVMKKSKKQVDNLLYNAKSKLRAILGKDGEELL